ncbi:HNH endonuclease [Candidatus Chlorohelix allophototropha]|uniref:HNH endonuclease n=1 Tax=Candidatus Chlorohelix allophototropha TaxID=3003348 RepID=A0ABY9AYX3_9CHLR|nr:HNH endonuclease [Chloroflexota bacterium L227-S17]
MSSEPFENYLKMFGTLRQSKDRSQWPAETLYAAPYKPILLLSILDLLEQGFIRTNLIELSQELGELFTLYCSKVLSPEKIGNIGMPFYHLTGEGFWHLLPKPGFENLSGDKPSASRLKKVLIGAKFDDALFSLLVIKEVRDAFRNLLVQKYFSESIQHKLIELSQVNKAAFEYSENLLKKPAQNLNIKEVADGSVEYVKQVRDQAFRKAVVKAYNHRCAICGLRVITAEGHTAVAAAHIVPWSISKNDSITNGIALCHLCHWAFDDGVTGISNNYLVLASEQLNLSGNAPGVFLMVRDRPIFKPDIEERLPDLEALHWHRKNVFKLL